jgi:hypothetical protein
VHQQFAFVAVAPHPKLAPHLEQLFDISWSMDAELMFMVIVACRACDSLTRDARDAFPDVKSICVVAIIMLRNDSGNQPLECFLVFSDHPPSAC